MEREKIIKARRGAITNRKEMIDKKMYVENNLIDRLTTLSKEKQLLFGMLAAERFFICYKIFNQREEFRNVVHLLEALSLIERCVLGEKIIDSLRQMQNETEFSKLYLEGIFAE